MDSGAAGPQLPPPRAASSRPRSVARAPGRQAAAADRGPVGSSCSRAAERHDATAAHARRHARGGPRARARSLGLRVRPASERDRPRADREGPRACDERRLATRATTRRSRSRSRPRPCARERPAVVDVLREALAASRERAVRRCDGGSRTSRSTRRGRSWLTAGDTRRRSSGPPGIRRGRPLSRRLTEVTFARDASDVRAQRYALARIGHVDADRALRVARAPDETAFERRRDDRRSTVTPASRASGTSRRRSRVRRSRALVASACRTPAAQPRRSLFAVRSQFATCVIWVWAWRAAGR